MPVIQGRTREQLRVDVGYNLGHPFVTIEADATGISTTFISDDIPLGSNGEHRGKWLVFTSGTNDGSVRKVTGSAVTDGQTTLIFHPAASAATADGHTAELWNEDHDPASIHNFINQAIKNATGSVYDPVTDISLHADGKTTRFDIPTGFAMLQKVEFAAYATSEIIHDMNSTFTESTDADIEQAVDDEDYKRGGNALKLTIAGTVSNADFISDAISSIDLSGYTHLEGWVKATSAIAAADFNICLDNATCTCDGNDKETLPVPAVSADTWTFFRIELANPESDTAIISVGIEYNANAGANTVWFDELRATNNDQVDWREIPRHLWGIDKPNRDLILKPGGVNLAEYALLKLTGGDEPALLTTDSGATEIDDSYIVQFATGMELMHESGSTTTDTTEKFRRGQIFMKMAERSLAGFPMLVNVRTVD